MGRGWVCNNHSEPKHTARPTKVGEGLTVLILSRLKRIHNFKIKKRNITLCQLDRLNHILLQCSKMFGVCL